MNNVVSLSGGKDSTAMLHMMLERGENIHSVVFFDTGWEFPEMHDHIDLVEKKTGVRVIKLRPEKPFEYWMFSREKEKGDVGKIGYGWPNTFRWCTELKTRELDKFTKTVESPFKCIGIAADELHRLRIGKRYPLVEWGITGKDALAYCENLGYTWGGLYKIFNRVSCWCCPKKSLPELKAMRKHLPEVWTNLLKMDARQPSHVAPFKSGKTVADLEQRFSREESFPSDFPAHVVRRFMKNKSQQNIFEAVS